MMGITIWMDYLGYATMHFCQILILLIFACFDSLVMLSYYSTMKTTL